MRTQLEQRLTQLKNEFEAGQKMLVDLETKQANLKQTLLRISGAIQVLEELLDDAEPVPAAQATELPVPIQPVVDGKN